MGSRGKSNKVRIIELQNDINYSSTKEALFDKLIDTKKYINNKITTLFNKTDLSGKDLINAGRRQEQMNNNWEVSLSFSVTAKFLEKSLLGGSPTSK